MTTALSVSSARESVTVALLPIMAVVLVAFLVIGLGLPVLPLHVHTTLGFGTLIVGVVTGSQFVASLLSRFWSGRTCDTHGPKVAVIAGLAAASASGLIYGLSLYIANPTVSVIALIAGRALLGAAESIVITGATVWGLSRAGAASAGKVIAWMGTAMFAAFAISAPIGVVVYSRAGFAGIAAITTLAPVLTLLVVWPLRGVIPDRKNAASMFSVISKIWAPGLGAALSSIGFGVIVSFASLLFASHGWMPVWLAFSSYAVALILARLLFGHLPDKVGGARVALACAIVEASGLAIMGLSSSVVPAAVGAALTGLGYALVFPGLGVEAVKRAPPASRGIAMGAYTACLDLALGVSGPLLGLIAGHSGFSAVFLVAAICVLCVVPIALRLK
ncbi:arabinose transporter [Rhizobium jaguaris]|uniref:MFS transporter n=1 Tax=Rhizobium jaguaris TaxID=1312183 RepID=A0A387G1R0_9HYPH|nr:arabinose transporter [Rhizobium jaguaris]AYG62284.1 MFS transporter [Rhizobium jaguaris]